VSTIGFLEPLFLWGLLFSGVVLLIHLLKRPRTVRLAFSTLRFFSESAVASNRSRRLRRWLLLLVRLLLAALIVVLFARPFNKRDRLFLLTDPSSELYVWIDPTPSMGYADGGIPLYEQAISFLDTLVGLRGSSSGIFVFDGDQAGFISCERFGETPFRLKFTTDIPAFETAFRRVAALAKHPVAVVLSDFEKTTTEALCAMHVSGLPGVVQAVAVTLSPKHPWNLSITGVKASVQDEGSVEIGTAAYGEKGASGSVMVITGSMRSPPVSCTLATGGSVVVPVAVRAAAGPGWGTAQLQAADPLPFDNTGYFTTGQSVAYSVLLIGDETVNFPLSAALMAADTVRWGSVVRMDPQRVTFDDCAAADLIVVNGCRQAVAPLTVLQGVRGIKNQAFIITGAVDSVEDRVWLQLGGPAAQRSRSVLSGPALAVKLPDTVSGLWHEFPGLLCSEVNVYSYRTGLQGTVLLTLTNDAPLAVAAEDAFGRRWVFCATPLGITSANNLCETGFYVPFIDRLARYACAGLAQRDAQWVAGRPIKNQWYGSTAAAQIFSAEGGQPLLRLQQQQVFVINEPGVYKVVPPGASPYYKTVAVDSLEGRCDYRIPESKSEACGEWTVVSPGRLVTYLRDHNRTLWWVMPWLLLAVLMLGELLLRERRRL
jgi:hypothetical protein